MTRHQLIEKYDLDILMGADCDPEEAHLENFVWEKLFSIEVEWMENLKNRLLSK